MRPAQRQGTVRRHHLHQCLPAVPGPAADRQADPAVVRRLGGGVVDLHGVLPGRAAGRLRLCGLDHAAAARARAGAAARRAAAREPGLPADRDQRALEAGRQPRSRRCGSSACCVGTIGLPYFLLSTTGPLVQAWVARTPGARRCTATSRCPTWRRWSSLLCYPVLIEPRSTLLQQAWAGRWRYGVFVLLCAATALYVARHWASRPRRSRAIAPTARRRRPRGAKPRGVDYLLWLALPALGSWLLLAITNHITQNVARHPLPVGAAAVGLPADLRPDASRATAGTAAPCSCRWRPRCWRCAPSGCRTASARDLQHRRCRSTSSACSRCACSCTARWRACGRRPAYLTRFYLMLSLGGAIGGVQRRPGRAARAAGVLRAGHRPGAVRAGRCRAVAAQAHRHGGLAGAGRAAAAGSWRCRCSAMTRGARRMERNFYGALLTHGHAAPVPEDGVRAAVPRLDPARRAVPRARAAAASPPPTTGHTPASAARSPRRRDGPRQRRAHRPRRRHAGRLWPAGRRLPLLRDQPAGLRAGRHASSATWPTARRASSACWATRGWRWSAKRRRTSTCWRSTPSRATRCRSTCITAEAMDVYLRHMQPDGVIAFHVTNRYLAWRRWSRRSRTAKGLHVALVHDKPDEHDLRPHRLGAGGARSAGARARADPRRGRGPTADRGPRRPGPTTSTTCSAC